MATKKTSEEKEVKETVKKTASKKVKGKKACLRRVHGNPLLHHHGKGDFHRRGCFRQLHLQQDVHGEQQKHRL